MRKIVMSAVAVAAMLVMANAAQAAGPGKKGNGHGQFQGKNVRFNKSFKHVPNYHYSHARKFSHGYYYLGRSHNHWQCTHWCPQYRCNYHYCSSACCWYYYCAPRCCYYPVSYITHCPPY